MATRKTKRKKKTVKKHAKRVARTPAKTYWLDDPRNVNKLVYGLYAVCGLLLLLDVLHLYHKHVEFEFEHLWGFYGLYGFISYVSLIHIAKVFRWWVKRREDYYDD